MVAIGGLRALTSNIIYHCLASTQQPGMQPKAAISLLTFLMNALVFVNQFVVDHLWLAVRPPAPCIVTTRRYFQQLSIYDAPYPTNRKLVPMVGNGLESLRLGCEKMATAFLRISHSWHRNSISPSSWRSCSSQSVSFPLPGRRAGF